VFSAGVWVVGYPDRWLVALFLVVDPAAAASAILSMWVSRGQARDDEASTMRRLQAKVGLGLVAAAVVVGYVYVMTHKAPFTPVGQ